jgi:hypothetical protein
MAWKTWSTGVDWLTCTIPTKDCGAQILDNLMQRELKLCEQRGEKLQPAGIAEAKGQRSQHLWLLEGPGYLLAQGTSDSAHGLALKIAEQVPRVNVTRIDTQETSHCDTDADKFIFRRALKFIAEGSIGADNRSRSARFWTSPRGADTLTIGSPQSEVQGLLYNKSQEAKGQLPEGLIRIEARRRGDTARAAWNEFTNQWAPLGWCRSLTRSTLERQGLALTDWPHDEPVRLPTASDQSTLGKTLRWYEAQVVPSVQRLMFDGHGDEAADVLAPIRLLWLAQGEISPDVAQQYIDALQIVIDQGQHKKRKPKAGGKA